MMKGKSILATYAVARDSTDPTSFANQNKRFFDNLAARPMSCRKELQQPVLHDRSWCPQRRSLLDAGVDPVFEVATSNIHTCRAPDYHSS